MVRILKEKLAAVFFGSFAFQLKRSIQDQTGSFQITLNLTAIPETKLKKCRILVQTISVQTKITNDIHEC